MELFIRAQAPGNPGAGKGIMLPLNLRVNSLAALRAISLLVCWRDTALSSAVPDQSSLTP